MGREGTSYLFTMFIFLISPLSKNSNLFRISYFCFEDDDSFSPFTVPLIFKSNQLMMICNQFLQCHHILPKGNLNILKTILYQKRKYLSFETPSIYTSNLY